MQDSSWAERLELVGDDDRWSCTDREMDAIAQLPDQAWTVAIEQNGQPVQNLYVADLTGLLDLDGWQQKIPGLRVLVRDEPLHPR